MKVYSVYHCENCIRLLPKAIFLIRDGYAQEVSEIEAVEVLFSPEDNCGARILEVLDSALESIDVAMYSFTNRILAQALVRAQARGVRVRVFLDPETRSQQYAKTDYLSKKAIPVRFEQGEGSMHNKFCVVDEKIVCTGSFNWTVYADLRNDENLTIIRSRQVGRLYKDKFERLWEAQGLDQAVYSDESRLKKALSR